MRERMTMKLPATVTALFLAAGLAHAQDAPPEEPASIEEDKGEAGEEAGDESPAAEGEEAPAPPPEDLDPGPALGPGGTSVSGSTDPGEDAEVVEEEVEEEETSTTLPPKSGTNMVQVGEILYSAAFRALQVGLIGPAVWMYALYEFVFQCCTMFHHANLRVPLAAARLMNLVLVTPRMHGVHHSAFLTETDSNYSVIFSWWDRLHRTLVLNVRQGAIDVGVPAYRNRGDNRLWSLLVMPFSSQRDYWRRAEGRPPSGNQGPTVHAAHMLP